MTLPTHISFETDPRGGILQEWICQGYLTALRALDLEIVSPERRFLAAPPADADDGSEPRITITCVDPVAERRSAWSGERKEGEYVINILPHGRIPEHAVTSGIFSRFDELWVSSASLAAALSIRLPIPVIQILPVISAGGYVAGLRKNRAADDRFVIATALDLGELERSDRPITILEAFKRAFERNDEATMVVRCDGGEACRDGLERLRLEIGSYPITVETDPRGTEGALKMIAAADAYLSLDRLDESTIEIAHAMAVGLPVVATGSPANMAFMSPWNSFPVHAEQISPELALAGSPMLQAEWEPSIEHASRLLRYLYETREDRIARGERARHDISALHAVGIASAAIGRRLETIMAMIVSSRRRSQKQTGIAPTQQSMHDPVTERLGDLESRMADLAAREEELRQLLGDLRSQGISPQRGYVPPPKSEPRTEARPEPRPEERPAATPRATPPTPQQNGMPPAEPDQPKKHQADLPAPFRAAEPPPSHVPTSQPAAEPEPLESERPELSAIGGQTETSMVVRESRKALMSVTPFNSTVIVVSGGNDDYLQLEGRTGWHFPQTADGRHSELLPDNATRAINALEALKNKGAHYLLFPSTSFWWLSLFPALGGHLDKNYRRIWGDEQCIIYEIADPGASAAAAPEQPTEKGWKMFKRR
jgi:hypothetical protein